MARERVLVIGQDLDSLSRIYLALIHRNYKAEACNNAQEIPERLKRFKPAVIVLDLNEYKTVWEKLKIPAVVIIDNNEKAPVQMNDGDILLKKPVQAESLIKAVGSLI